jgi:hypothetical protein
MAENGFRAAEEHGGHPTTALAQKAVSNRVDAAVHNMKVASLDPPLDLSIAQTELDQLTTCDHAVLAFGQPRNTLIQPRAVTRAPFRLYRRPKGACFRFGNCLALHAADDGRLRRISGALRVTFVQRKEAPARRYRLWL